MATVCAIGAAVLLGCQLLRHYAFATPAYDLRIHEELVANTLQGRFLYSDLLGQSFLGHHLSLIFPLCAPLYALWPSPVCLMVLQGLLVGCAGWWLWRIALSSTLRPMIALALVCSFFMFKGLHSGYFRGFQQEILGMCLALGFLWAVQTNRRIAALALGLLTLSCREDFALFLLGAGVAMFLQKSQRACGFATALVSLAWLVLAYVVVIPSHAPAGQMAGVERWAQYGSTPTAIVAHWLTHPLSIARAITNHGAMEQIWRLLFLPLASPGTWITTAAPWLIYTTSAFGQQAALGGAYAAMFVAFLFYGAIRTLSVPALQSLASRNGAALPFSILLILVSGGACPLPRDLAGLPPAHAALERLNAYLPGKKVLAQGCIIPHLERAALCDMLGSARATAMYDYDLVLICPRKDPWPLDTRALDAVEDGLSRSDAWDHEYAGCLHVFRKKRPPRERECQAANTGTNGRQTPVSDQPRRELPGSAQDVRREE